jgi:hypothetical protein
MTRARDIADQQDNLGGAVAPFVSGKNFVINGGMDIWQRGTSFVADLTYSADRWLFNRTGGVGGSSISRSTDAPTGFQYSLKNQRDSGNTILNALDGYYSIETTNSIPLAGKIVTLSFYMKKGANYSGGDVSITVNYGTGTDQRYYLYTGATQVVNGGVTLSTSWQRFSVTGTVASTATEIGFKTSWSPTGTAGADDSVYMTGFQLEVGSAATPFARAGGSIGGELALCQRYFWRNTGFQVAGGSQSANDNNVWFALNTFNAVPMRTTPTAAIESTPYIADFQANLRDIVSVNCVSKTVVGFAYSSTKLTTALSYGLNFSDAGRALSFSSEL